MTKDTISFYGGVGNVTGSNFIFRSGDVSIIIDCGLIQGATFCEDENRKRFLYDPKSIEAVFITHGHLDHIGRLPKLVREGFSRTIYSTPETKLLAELILEDAIKIMELELESDGAEPLYKKEDVQKTLSLWRVANYHEQININDKLKVEFKDAGHILGSAMIYIKTDKNTIIFTGDLGNSPSPMLKDTEDITDADYMVIESVYGDRNHEGKEERVEKLKRIIKKTIATRGILMIPAFSIERTQMILYDINKLVEGGGVESIPVFLDSPLAIKVTEIYKNNQDNFNKKTAKLISAGDDVFDFPGLVLTKRKQDSLKIQDSPSPKIIIAGSGMSNGGRIRSHEKKYLQDKKNTILFVGYQAAESLGRKIFEGEKNLEIDGEKIRMKAKVEKILSYSSHKDRDGLLEFVEKSEETLKKVFVVMGEPKASQFLAQRINDYLETPATVPSLGDTVELS